MLGLVVAAQLGSSSLHAGGTPATGTTSDQIIYTQGSGSETEFGDYVSSNNASSGVLGLDEVHRYRIEVVPGLSTLQIEIFDADAGIGGLGAGATDEGGERDKPRGTIDGSAFYRLYNPFGGLVSSSFIFADDTRPAGSDNAWLTYM